MKDFELIVYIVAALIYFVSKNYRKVQQNQPGRQPAQSPAVEKESPKPLPAPIKRKKEVLSAPAQSAPSQKIPYQAMKRQSLAKEYKPVRKTKTPDYLKTEVDSTKNFFQNLVQNEAQLHAVQINEPEDIKPYLVPDDLKKAIIYAEIIKRPYN